VWLSFHQETMGKVDSYITIDQSTGTRIKVSRRPISDGSKVGRVSCLVHEEMFCGPPTLIEGGV